MALSKEKMRQIKTAVRKWEDSDIKELVRALITSHEEIRFYLEMADDSAAIDRPRRRRKR
jgi:hypothetical protein